MRGLLFYDKIGEARNKWFIARLIESARERGCELELIITDGAECVKEICAPLPDFAIVRTILPQLTLELEKLGIPTFNNYETSRVANDKWQTYLLARELGITVMPTELINDGLCLTLPKVIKTVDGHGGSEVFLAKSAEEYAQILTRLGGKRAIAQELCDEPGVDMRVYVLGNNILAPVKRTSESDFRSNFSLGGSVELGKVTDGILDTVKKLKDALGFDFVGIDFIRHGGEWLLNEIEDVVGTRMLYSLTDIDAAEAYVDYIILRVKSINQK